MKVSICMIAFNQAMFIEQALDGVAMQRTGFDFELVIGDDCSTDGTRAIIERRANRDPRMRVLPRPQNLGMMRNFWSTLEACRGEYVAMLEGDDYWTDPLKLQRQADLLDRQPHCAMTFHRTLVLEEASGKTRHSPRFAVRRRYRLADLLRRGNFMHTASVMFRNRQRGEPPAWLLEQNIGDYVMHVINAAEGEIAYLPRTMGVYRVHQGGVHSSIGESLRLERLLATLDRLDEHFQLRYAALIDIQRDYLRTVQAFRGGDLENARRHARARLHKAPFDTQSVTAALVLYAPWLYRLTRRLVS